MCVRLQLTKATTAGQFPEGICNSLLSFIFSYSRLVVIFEPSAVCGETSAGLDTELVGKHCAGMRQYYNKQKK